MAAVRAKMEVKHRAQIVDRSTYETARQETLHFILRVVEDTWVWELRDAVKILHGRRAMGVDYPPPKACYQPTCVDLLALMDQMIQYHLEH